jgi:hypothetical protein
MRRSSCMVYSPHMVAKKTTLDALARMISKASASADNKFAALAEDIARLETYR